MSETTFFCSNCGRTLPNEQEARNERGLQTGVCRLCYVLPLSCWAGVAAAFADQRRNDWEEQHPGRIIASCGAWWAPWPAKAYPTRREAIDAAMAAEA